MPVTPEQILIALALLQLKHVLADFVLQSRFILENRHRYGHPGGVLHAGIHVAGSAAALWAAGFGGAILLFVLLGEALAHYHIDWAKDGYVARNGLTTNDNAYWVAMGTDQALHQLTYLAMMLALYLAGGHG